MTHLPSMPTRRLRACVEAWPDCYTGGYDPSCCRFPKSCSATVYDEEHTKEEDLEPEPQLSTSGSDEVPAGWLLIQGNEDGNPITFLDQAGYDEATADPGTYGVTRWLDAVPEQRDPNYWPEGDALMVRIEVVQPPQPAEPTRPDDLVAPDKADLMTWAEFDRIAQAVRDAAGRWGLCMRCTNSTPVDRYGRFAAHKREIRAGQFEVCPGTGMREEPS